MSIHQIETAALKLCNSCSAELPADYNFCRWCGVSQEPCRVTAPARASWSDAETKALRKEAEEYQTLSNMLVNTLTQSVSLRTAALRHNRVGGSLVTAAIAVPIWLLIILLSPLDAYTASRAASSRVN